MTTFEIILLLLVIGGFGGIFWFLNKKSEGTEGKDMHKLREENADLKAKLEQRSEEVGKLEAELDQEKSERDKLEGKGKQLFAEITGYKEENKNLRIERDEFKSKITKFESSAEQREREFMRLTEQLENSRRKLTEEQERVKREDEEKLAQERAEHDRIWNDHEKIVTATLRDTCQNQHIAFSFYENTKLPDGFDGSVKPDFLVEFLGQYIIFDAKKSKDPKTYLSDQVKKTAQKIRKSQSSGEIYPVVFFVIPTENLIELPRTYFYEEGISFFCISPESIEPILAAYKRITDYEKISEFDPQDREKIVDLIARYDRHISFQNAANILLAKEGVNVMSSKDDINEEIRGEVEVKKKNMRAPKLSDSELKRLTQSFEEQGKDMEKLIAPKQAIKEEDLEEVQRALL